MVKVVVCTVLVLLISMPLILPEPLKGMPVILGMLSLVQLYTVPGTLPVNMIGVIGVLLQIVWADGVATALGISTISSLAMLAYGLFYFRRTERRFADVA